MESSQPASHLSPRTIGDISSYPSQTLMSYSNRATCGVRTYSWIGTWPSWIMQGI